MISEAPYRLRLLGGFEIEDADSRLVIPTKKAQGLLAYLALNAEINHPREKLIGLLWGESEEKHAQHNLRQALTYLRKPFNATDPPPLSADRAAVQLTLDLIEVDVLRFRQLVAEGSAEGLEAAIDLYQGDLLDGLSINEPEFQNWLETERRNLRETYEQALASLLDLRREAGDLTGALRLAQQLLAQDALQERIHRILMQLYVELGMREAALKQFEQCRDILAEELGVEPESETIALYEQLRNGGLDEPARLDSEQPGASAESGKSSTKSSPVSAVRVKLAGWGLAAAVVAAVFVGSLVWFRPWEPKVEPASVARMAFPLPEQPSIAVLPFDNLSGDTEQDYFADGITDDLITDLSKIPGLFVIARDSTFAYKDKNTAIRQVAEDLGIRYVLEGSVRRVGDEVRINAQLIDATTGGHLWAERYDGKMTDVFELQGQVTSHVADALEVELTNPDYEYSGRQETDTPEAYDAVLRALEHQRNYTREDFAITLSYLEKAVRLDPDYARAHTLLGGTLWNIANEDWERSFGMTHEGALEKARHHFRLGMKAPSFYSHFFQSKMLSNEGRYEEAVVAAEKVIALNPNGVDGNEALGRALNKAGRAAEAIEPLQKALRLNPLGDEKGWLLYRLGESLYLSARYQEAAEAFEVSVAKNNNEWTYLFLAAALAQHGKLEKAGVALANFDKIRAEAGEHPYTVARVESWAFKNPADRENVQEGLRKAGMPEGAETETELGFAQDLTPVVVAGATTVDAEQTKNLVERGVKMIDVRDRADWADGHIPGTLHLYLYQDFTEAALSAIVAKDEKVVLYAKGAGGSKMAAIAAARAVSWGFQKVYYFRDGFPSWKAAGFPTQVAQN